MGRPQKTPFSNKKTKIICRYCGPEGTKLNRQSYCDHLKVAHNDSSGNLREWGQSSLFAFGSSPRKRMEAEGVQGEDGCLDIISKISLAVIDHYKLESFFSLHLPPFFSSCRGLGTLWAPG